VIQIDPAAFVSHKTQRLTICFFLYLPPSPLAVPLLFTSASERLGERRRLRAWSGPARGRPVVFFGGARCAAWPVVKAPPQKKKTRQRQTGKIKAQPRSETQKTNSTMPWLFRTLLRPSALPTRSASSIGSARMSARERLQLAVVQQRAALNDPRCNERGEYMGSKCAMSTLSAANGSSSSQQQRSYQTQSTRHSNCRPVVMHQACPMLHTSDKITGFFTAFGSENRSHSTAHVEGAITTTPSVQSIDSRE
jgi:hypothetical protein